MSITIWGKKKLTPFVPCLGCFIILLYLRDFMGVSIPSMLFLGLAFLVAAFADKTEVIAFCFCCIPVLNAFQSKYALLICMGLYICRFFRSLRLHLCIIPIALLVVWECMHVIVGDFSGVEVLRLFTELFFCCFVMCLSPEDIDFKKIVRSMSVIAIGACCILLLAQLKLYNFQIDMLFSGVFRLGYGVDETKMSVGFNPNYLAYICLCCIEGIAFLVYKKQSKIIDLIYISLLSVFGLLTMSKKFIVCALIFLFLFLLSQKGKLKTFLYVVIIIIVVLLVFQQVFPTAYDALLLRFNQDDMSTGRGDIFSYFNEQLMSDMGLLLFGVGLQGYGDKLLTRYDFSIPHNGFQELLVMWGIPGLLIFVSFLILLLSRGKKLNKHIRFVNYIPFIIMMLNVQVSQMVSSSVVNILTAFVYICLVTNMDSNQEPEEMKLLGV